MNRENKRQQYQTGYYKTHPCRDSFSCRVCGRLVKPEGAGSSHRNHCPNCLCSLHVDITPGDRAADCGGVMEPVAVWVRKNGRRSVSFGASAVIVAGLCEQQTSCTPAAHADPTLTYGEAVSLMHMLREKRLPFLHEGHAAGHGRSGSQCWLCR